MLVVLVLLGLGITYVVAFGLPFSSSKPAGPVSLPLGQFTTNLNDPQISHYIQVSITLEVRQKSDADLLNADGPEVRNGILAILRNQTYDETLQSAGMERIGKELTASLDHILGHPDVEKVYFTDFLVQ